jgi:HEAT repeat protein
MSEASSLDGLLASGNWSAVDLARTQGAAAIPSIQRAAKSPRYDIRQIAVACAAAIRSDAAARILAEGLIDSDFNVRLQAANSLVLDPPASIHGLIVSRLTQEPDDRVKEALAIAAGFVPGDGAIAALKLQVGEVPAVALAARMALAKRGDKPARELLEADLQSPDTFKRYTAVGWLRYIDDPIYIPQAKRLLQDRANAQKIGPKKAIRYRRVCDQAADTLIALLKLKPSFEHDVETIYTDAQLSEIARLAG